MVYVISSNGQPLMPTERHGKVRRLLRDCKAKVVKRCPFTIQLLYVTTNVVQAVTLGVDAGSKVVGLSATTEKKVLFESEVELRNDIVKLLASRRELRRSRRYRKTRYRKQRFDNRKRKDGWLAPSVQHKIETHLTVIRKVYEILPVSKIVVEVASFDIQKIKNPDIQGKQYQQGEQFGFWNVREYVLFRDGHTCQCCKGKSKDKVLNVHHIESRKVGGDAPNNLVTLCETCHMKFHKGEIELPKEIKRGTKFDDATFMGIMRWVLYDELKAVYGSDNVFMTFGYITKHVRIQNSLPKEHYIDARCISGNPLAAPDGVVYYQRKVRRHNRQLYKVNTCKGGIRKANQAPYIVKGFRLFDKVLYKKQTCFIFGRRSSGYFDLRLFDGTKISASALVKDIKLIDMRKGFLIERRSRFPLTTKVASI